MANKTKSNSKAKKSRSGMKKSKKPAKSIPANRYLRYELTNSSDSGTEVSRYIDLARDLSAINRKLMRQGRCYHVKRISIVSRNTIAGITHVDQSELPGVTKFSQNAGFISFSVIPDGWVSRNAWKRGFETWRKMNAEASKNVSGKLEGTWSDFKVYLSNDHRTGTVLNPIDNGGFAVSTALREWEYASLVSPDGTTSADTFNVHMLGDHVGSPGTWTSVGLVQSYGASRLTVDTDDPNSGPLDANDPLLNLFDDGTTVDEVITRLRDHNDNPPYNPTLYPGVNGNMPKPHVVQQTTLGADGRGSVGGFSAMCGLIEIEATSPIESDVYSVLVELAPGKYRGIGAEVI